MASPTPARGRPETKDEFMARRNREAAARDRKAEARAHQEYGKATRIGLDLRLPTSSDVLTWGSRLNHSPYVIGAAGTAGHITGFNRGLARGGQHMAEGLLDSALFLGRLNDPYDSYKSPPGQSAQEQLIRAGKSAVKETVGYLKRAATDPTVVQKDLNRAGQRISRDLNPMATPAAGTAVGEFKRLNDIGANQGELAFDVGTAAIGAPEIKVLATVGRMSKEAKIAKYVARGEKPAVAEYLAEPYVGKGSHWIPQRVFKKHLGDGPVVNWLRDSPFNVSKPRGFSRGDQYEHHFEVDPNYYGSPLPKGLGAKGWSGRRAGLQKRGPIGRVVVGAPDAVYSTVGAGAGGAGWAIEDLRAGESER
jgi:hypothetical protein